MTNSICFLFGGVQPTVNGGTKVILQYANMMAQSGWDVHLVFSLYGTERNSLCKKLKITLFLLYNFFISGISVRNWFSVNKSVNIHYVFSLSYKNVPSTDIYVATYVSTAAWLNTYPIDPKRKFYFIQDFEIWEKGWDEGKTRETYHFNMCKFVISRWLKELLEEDGEQSIQLPNGFDFSKFSCVIPVEIKNKYSVTFLYHNNPHKGVGYTLGALKLVKQKYPQLVAKCFGTYRKRPDCLPNWIDYYSKPENALHNQIYNESSIFIASSVYEGWGLTVGEAMICGAAIVCTDTAGFREMVEDGITGLISPIRDIKSMADNIVKLIEDDRLRISIAQNGRKTIQRFTWDYSFKLFQDTIRRKLFEN